MANILLNEQSTLAEIAHCYLNNIVKGCYANSTYNSYRVRLEKHILPIIGDRQVRELKKLDVQNMIFELKNQANPLSANTIRLVRSVLNRVLDFAVDLEIANRNVAYRVSLPKQSKYQPRIYTCAEIENLLDVAKGTILYIPILLAAKAGLRRSEILSLRWGNVNFPGKSIVVANLTKEQSYSPLKTLHPKQAIINSTSLPQQ